MAWGYRNRRKYYRRRYYRRGYGRGTNRRAYGNMRAAKQQADNATFTLNVPTKFATFMKSHAHIDGTPALEQNTTGVYPISIYDLLRRSEFFNNYANMYDEFKIDKIKVKLLPTAFTVNTNGNYRSLTVYTAWDRTGLNATQVRSVFDKQHPQNNKIYCTIGEDITTYSSAESRTVNPGANTSITRWLNPKTITEKSQWLSTALLKKWYDEYNDDLGCFTGIKFDGDDYDLAQISTIGNDLNSIIKWSACAKDNPCFLLEDPSIKFKPTLLVGVYPPIRADDTTNTSNKIHFNVETEIVCTYRGLRKGKVLSTGEQSGQQLIVGPKPTVIRSDGTYNASSDGLDGYSSVTVEVGGGGGDNTPPDNTLTAILDDYAVRAAKGRTDPIDPNDPSKGTFAGYMDWPKLGDVVWNNYINVEPDTNATWVNKALINVSNINLAEEWHQSSPLTPDLAAVIYQQGFNQNNAVYPENFVFKENNYIIYNNNTPTYPGSSDVPKNYIVNLTNSPERGFNILSQMYNVGAIDRVIYQDQANPTDQEIQDEINANPSINPVSHNTWFNQDENGQVWANFTFQLPTGEYQKTVDPAGDTIMEGIPLPRLYANRIRGKFKIPTTPNPNQPVQINTPGQYAIGDLVSEPANQPTTLEIEPVQQQNQNLNLRLIKTENLTDEEQSQLFTLAKFNIDVAKELNSVKIVRSNNNSQSPDTETDIYEPFDTDMDVIEPSETGVEIDFSGALESEESSIRILVLWWCGEEFGYGFKQINENGEQYNKINFYNNSRNGDDLVYTYFVVWSRYKNISPPLEDPTLSMTGFYYDNGTNGNDDADNYSIAFPFQINSEHTVDMSGDRIESDGTFNASAENHFPLNTEFFKWPVVERPNTVGSIRKVRTKYPKISKLVRTSITENK